MKTIEQQMSDKCIHFNGIMNECCKAGIKYSEVRSTDKPYKFPCLKQGGSCASSQFRTPEEVEKRIAEMVDNSIKVLGAYLKVKDHSEKTKQDHGKLPCECGGELHYAVAQGNGHIRVKCSRCEIAFME